MSLFLKPIGTALTEALNPLKSAVSDPSEMEVLLGELGWNVEIDNSSIVTIATSLQSIINLVDDALVLVEDIQKQSGNELQNTIDLAQKIKDFFNTIKNYDQSSVLGIPGPMNDSFFWQTISERLPSYLICNYLRLNQPLIYGIFLSIGVIEIEDETPSGNLLSYQMNYKKFTIDITQLGDFVTDAPRTLRNLYSWNDPNNNFNHAKLLYNLEQFALGMKILVSRDTPIKALYNSFFTTQQIDDQRIEALTVPIISGHTIDETDYVEAGALIMPITKVPGTNAVPDGLYLTPLVRGQLGSSVPLTPELTLALNAEFEGTGVFGLKIFPDGTELDTNLSSGLIEGNIKLTGVPEESNGPWILLGAKGESRLELDGFEASLEILGSLADIEVVVALGTAEGGEVRFILEPGSGDGFISKIFTNSLDIAWDGSLQWSSKSGFGIQGHLGFEYSLPIHKTIGPLSVDELLVRLVKKSTGAGLAFSLNAGLKLGPFSATVKGIGVELIASKKLSTENQGILGNIELDLGFKPPTGLGLKMESKTISGGGFLSFNKDEGRYVGALELSIKDKIAIKAIGILTTKLPSGQPGYSLLLLITAEFQPIQLGFGFTLNGVGGIIALHRRMNTDGLRDGVRNGSIDNILFPTNPVENIDSIISSLETVFPIQEGRYSFGPMAIIGWGTPTLITAELGLFFELPGANEFALIGVIRALLPNKDKPVLKLQIAFAGIINFEKKTITFDATLFDSSVAGMGLSGDMVFRLVWGDKPTFVLSVGGFHPKFPIPPLNIPNMRRLTINLIDGEKPRLTLSTYFAITSNTAQFGAAIDFLWAINDNIDLRGHLGFDALFYFSPFRFEASIDGSLEVRRKDKAILSISFAGLLEGPTPWHVQGNVSFKVLGVEFDKDFDKTFGDHDTTTLLDVKVLDKLIVALEDKKNWQATVSDDVPLLVTIREFNTSGPEVVVHPQGKLAVSQKIVPLDIDITRFGNCRPDPLGYSYFSLNISYDASTTNILQKDPLKEYFAPNEFFNLSETDRLNSASFQELTSGLEVKSTSTALKGGKPRRRRYEYEQIIMDSRRTPVRMTSPSTIAVAFRANSTMGTTAANSNLGSASTDRLRASDAPLPITETAASFAIAKTSDLTSYNSLIAGSRIEAQKILEQQLLLNPALEGQLQIVNQFEVAV
ncbi:hypothetical protein CNR22_18320 [Sphingobacteriaceae bacterium]|nr:hypothetical protein CNR22_18320 [Sphingobacteriaceae bacterium]